ncbi:MAG: peptide chain release factor 2 [Bacillota bacterium]|nr:peptide chain release factor 2 [Bacillota bacterium]
MLEFDEMRLELTHMADPIEQLKQSMDIDNIIIKIGELEKQTLASDFYEDMGNSQKVLRQISQLKSKKGKFDSVYSHWEELTTLCELGDEMEDLSVIDELSQGIEKLKNSMEGLRLDALLSGPYDKNNAILTVHAGAGGTEAHDWTEMLLRMYMRWAERRGFGVKLLDELEGEEAGVKSATILIEGDNAYGYAKAESGVHRLVRISPFDAASRRHTSFAACEVIPEIDDEISVEINPEDLRVDTYRSSGAGGQHVNKTESAIRITHIPSGVVVSCQNERSQIQNRETAMKMLRSKLVEIAQREHYEKISDIKGVQKEIAWGSQIRSYVFQPYTMVKDHRTGYEVGNIGAVMDGDIDGFINEYLKAASLGKL